MEQTQGANPAKRQQFEGIQAGRGIAALLVVCTHLGSIAAEPRFYNTRLFGGVLDNFGVGVDFFFVLSGFVIAWAHWADIGDRSRLRRYATNRVLRIYPPYLIVLLPLSAVYFTFPAAGVPGQHDPLNFVFSIFLLPYPVHPILGVAWTLVHEMLFYAAFGLIIAWGRRALWLLPAWAAAIVALQIAFGDGLPYPANIVFSAHNLEFLLGILSARVLATRRIPVPAILATTSAIAFLTTMLFGATLLQHQLPARLVFGTLATLFILGIAEVERSRGLGVPRALMLLGSASYALYLVHAVILSMAISVFVHLWPAMPLPKAMVALFMIAVVAGIAYHLAVERPVTTLLKAHARGERIRRGTILKAFAHRPAA